MEDNTNSAVYVRCGEHVCMNPLSFSVIGRNHVFYSTPSQVCRTSAVFCGSFEIRFVGVLLLASLDITEQITFGTENWDAKLGF